MILHQFRNPHGMCFNLLFISSFSGIAITYFALQNCDLPQLMFVLFGKLDGRKLRLTGTVDPGKGFHR